MCTLFSTWQFVNDPKRPRDIEKKYGLLHLDWSMHMCALQMRLGGQPLHEHPVNANSWSQPSVRSLLARRGIGRVVGGQCKYGKQTEAGDPVKTPTGWMSNSPELLRLVGQRCDGRHSFCTRAAGGQHALCNGKVARRTAICHY